MKRIAKRIELKGKNYLTKLRIDRRTVVTLRNQESFMVWKTKFPQAVEVFLGEAPRFQVNGHGYG